MKRRTMLAAWMLLFIGCQAATDLHAQPHDIRFERNPLPAGFSENSAVTIAQDPHGYLWFGREGLARYDGYEIITYRHDPADSTSLAADWVERLYVDRAGTLWVGTYGGGLGRFNPATETFTRFRRDPDDPASLSQDSVTVILEDREGALWVGTLSGLNRFDRATGTFTRFRHDPDDPHSLSNDQVRALYEDRAGVLWVGTGSPWDGAPPDAGGLNRFDRATGTFTRYLHDPDDPQSLIDNQVQALFEDSRGTFWVGTAGDGLHSMDREAGTFLRYRYDPDDPGKLSRPHLRHNPSWGAVSFVYEDRSGMLWIGTVFGGLNRYDPATGTLAHFEHDPKDAGSLSDNAVWSIFEARDGTLWITTWSGLHKVVPVHGQFPHYTLDRPVLHNWISSIRTSSSGALWIGPSGGGLVRYDRATGTYTQYSHDPRDARSLSHNFVAAVHEDQAGRVWIGTQGGGLDRFDPATETFDHYRHDPSDPQSLSQNWVDSILEDHTGMLWIGTRKGGLNRFDPATETFTAYRYDPEDATSLSSDHVYTTYEDRAGTLWVGTGNGLSRLDRATGTFTNYQSGSFGTNSLRGGAVFALYEDDASALWVGTESGGLSRFDREAGTFTQFTRRDSGLPDDRVTGILGGERGALWISTGRGLARFDPAERTFRAYTLPVGSFNRGVFHKSPQGELFFGGQNGFTAFFPEQLTTNPHPPEVMLTSLRLLDERGPLQVPLRQADRVTLAHDQNVFTLDFVGLHYTDPSQNRYAFMLQGHDEVWREVGTQRQATYVKVPPGDYVFRVRAANSDDVWNEEGALIRVTILSPWWRTTWAYLLYGVLFAAGVFGVYRVQRRRLIHQEQHRAMVRELEQTREIEAMNQRLRAHQQQLETQNAQLHASKAQIEEQAQRLQELDELKSRFFANLSHEFRTPLTLILGPLRDALSGSYGPVSHRLQAQLHLMRRSGLRLLELISQLLDLSRLEAGSMTLRARRLDLIPFLHDLVVAFAARAEREHITLQFAADAETCPLYFEADKLEKVFTNLLSNAFKFTPEHGKIRVSVEEEEAGGAVAVAVRDTGQGIPREELLRVFDRFYQVNTSQTERHVGTGIGLSLARELVELHGGTITVESMPGFGTTFTVRLPLGRAHLRAEQIVEAGEEVPVAASEDKLAQQAARLPEAHDLEAELDEEVLPPEDAPCVLVVDDNADVRAYLRGHLEQYYRVTEVADGLDGLETARTLEPDLIIADVMMPLMDGFELCRALRQEEALALVPVVLLTARADEASTLEGLEGGADDYLTKPFHAEELLLRVEHLIEVRHQLRERYRGEVVLKPTAVVVSSQEAAFLEQVKAVVEQHLGDANFNVDRLAEEVGLSPRQLQRRLRESAKLSPAGFVRMMRLERAAQLLGQEAGGVSEVAYAVGFKNAQHFSRQFRQVFGVAPSEFTA